MVREQSEIPLLSPGPPAHLDTRLAEVSHLMGEGGEGHISGTVREPMLELPPKGTLTEFGRIPNTW